MAEVEQGRVARRRVFYIPGYDPIHPRRYRELYRKESAAQAALSGYRVKIAPRRSPERGQGGYGWFVDATIDGAEVEAEVDVLVWSDIVRQSMAQGIAATYWQLVRTAWIYIASGALWRLMGLRKGPIIAALYPVFMLIAQLVLAVGLGWMVGALVALVLPAWAGWIAAIVVIPMVLHWFRARDGKLFAYYLMHDYAYSARTGGANPPELEARMTAFRLTLAEALAGDFDEVLVVGHSSGAHLGVSILADLIRDGLPRNERVGGPPVLSFLTLGQVVPMVSFLPRADRLRADLNYLSARDEIAWVDITAPGDGCAFALCDPVAVSGVAPEGKRWPLVLSAAFTQTLSPARWKALRWRFFRLHFQYLCAFDRPDHYDYFKITAGPLTLGARYAGWEPSRSRIERPRSRHTSMAA
ncbi:hypothetical protein [Acidimangrovimonas sediminis]|uniref:hypothetical protein n=1 Tax=Acidimangrovimonas sediminis TaxID=2056283 RepID=UPI000C7FA290|nr:hypothetical protein [Acidimangrovimonas sediminis]